MQEYYYPGLGHAHVVELLEHELCFVHAQAYIMQGLCGNCWSCQKIADGTDCAHPTPLYAS